MRAPIRVSAIALCAMGLFACGGSRIAPNKEAAADAAYAASRGAGGAQGMVRAALMTPIVGTTTVQCPNGGSAALVYDGDSLDPTGGFSFDLTYSNCNYDGETAMTGTLDVDMAWIIDGSSAEVSLTMAGRISFSGAVNDFVELDVVQTIAASSASATSGTVSLHLDGTITTSSGTYTYDDETITITADGLDTES